MNYLETREERIDSITPTVNEYLFAATIHCTMLSEPAMLEATRSRAVKILKRALYEDVVAQLSDVIDGLWKEGFQDDYPPLARLLEIHESLM